MTCPEKSAVETALITAWFSWGPRWQGQLCKSISKCRETAAEQFCGAATEVLDQCPPQCPQGQWEHSRAILCGLCRQQDSRASFWPWAAQLCWPGATAWAWLQHWAWQREAVLEFIHMQCSKHFFFHSPVLFSRSSTLFLAWCKPDLSKNP